MIDQTSPLHRMQLLAGKSGQAQLSKTRVLLFGAGGVGSWAAEALVRSGIGQLTIVDDDLVCITNVNRQLQATLDNVGSVKVDELAKRLAFLNTNCKVMAVQERYTPESSSLFSLSDYDYVLDCIDSVSCKVHLICQAHDSGTKLFSSMGAACKLDPTQIRVASIWETNGCHLARTVRSKLREARFKGDFQTVFSPEVIADSSAKIEGKTTNGSAVHITAVFGMFLAGQVIQDVLQNINPDPDPAQ